MTKDKWIEAYTTGYFKDSDKQVITFIANFLYANTNISEEIHNLFTSGYCYYFAHMLKVAFNRGDICWHRNHGHIVWRDDNGIAYDICGVFYDYDENDLLPAEESLAEMIVGFKHSGEEFKFDQDFTDWAEHYKMTPLFALESIYMNMPREMINDDLTVSENSFLYWMSNERKLSEYYAEIKYRNKNK